RAIVNTGLIGLLLLAGARCGGGDGALEEDVGMARQAWTDNSETSHATPSDDAYESTHDWIVVTALEHLYYQFGFSNDEVNSLYMSMRFDEDCEREWKQGLHDADYSAIFAQPTSATSVLVPNTWESHFYDITTDKSWCATGPKENSNESAAREVLARLECV